MKLAVLPIIGLAALAGCEPYPGAPGYGPGYGYAAPAPAYYGNGYAPYYAPAEVVIGEREGYRGDGDRGRDRERQQRFERERADRGRYEQQRREQPRQEERRPPRVITSDPARPYIRVE